jgi:hypothetical protein
MGPSGRYIKREFGESDRKSEGSACGSGTPLRDLGEVN